MKKQLISFLLTCALLAVSLASNATIHYVYPGGSGAKDGSSWADAAPDIQYLLTPPLIVVPIPTPPFFDTIQPQLVFDRDSIFVASGTYQRVCMHKEGYQVNNVTTDSCALEKLHFYGGFKGYETSLEQRGDWLATPSIIDAQGGRAVWFEHPTPGAGDVVFDGFIVTGAGRRKEAFRIVNVNTWISHVIIKDNNGIPFFLEHVPFSSNDDSYSETALNNVVVMNNLGSGWPASVAVSAFSQLKVFNSTITKNTCDSVYYQGDPLALFYFYSYQSDFYFYNSIVYNNLNAGTIVNRSFPGHSPELYYKNSIIESTSNPMSDWNVYGTDLGNTLDVNPMLTSGYRLLYGSPAINLGDVNDYPFFQSIMLMSQSHPHAFWYADADYRGRFYVDPSNQMHLDAGAVQYKGNSSSFKDLEYWLKKKYPSNISAQTNSTDSPDSNVTYLGQKPMVYPTVTTPAQQINITNIPENSAVCLTDILGRMIFSAPLSKGEDMITSPQAPGMYLLVISQGNKAVSKELIIVKQ